MSHGSASRRILRGTSCWMLFIQSFTQVAVTVMLADGFRSFCTQLA